MEPPSPTRPAGPGLRDLMGFMVGFALASSLLRRVRPVDTAHLVSWVGFAVAFVWFGLTASGPFVAWLFRIGDLGELPDRKPRRPGQLIGSVPVEAAPRNRQPVPDKTEDDEGFLRPERVWIHLGSMWFIGVIGLNSIEPTSFASYLGTQTSLACIVLTLILWFSKRPPVPRWTDRLAWLILLTWPFAVGGLWLIGHG